MAKEQAKATSEIRLMTIAQAADFLGVSRQRVRNWLKTGKIGSLVTPDGVYLFDPEVRAFQIPRQGPIKLRVNSSLVVDVNDLLTERPEATRKEIAEHYGISQRDLARYACNKKTRMALHGKPYDERLAGYCAALGIDPQTLKPRWDAPIIRHKPSGIIIGARYVPRADRPCYAPQSGRCEVVSVAGFGFLPPPEGDYFEVVFRYIGTEPLRAVPASLFARYYELEELNCED